jgi:hypothetical protein
VASGTIRVRWSFDTFSGIHLRCLAVATEQARVWTGASERRHSVGTVSDRFQLPRARDAVIPTEKLVAYALDPDHPRGRHKARVFAAALGIGKSDWKYLRDQILEAVVDADVRGTRITRMASSTTSWCSSTA